LCKHRYTLIHIHTDNVKGYICAVTVNMDINPEKYVYETGQHGICELYDHKDEYSSFITHLWGKMNKDHLRKLYHLR
jgi:hypothetical protein